MKHRRRQQRGRGPLVIVTNRLMDLAQDELEVLVQVQGENVLRSCAACGSTVALSPRTEAKGSEMAGRGFSVVIKCVHCVSPDEVAEMVQYVKRQGGDLMAAFAVPGAEDEIRRAVAALRIRRQQQN